MREINDLYDYEPFKIIQDSDVFKFSLDSILLAEFVEIPNKDALVLDLCTGNAVVPLILSYFLGNKIFAFEIQDYIAKLAQESVAINKKNDQISIINDDLKNIKNYFPGNSFDVIVANPPYFKYKNTSLINENINKAIARHEIKLNLKELFEIVKFALKDNGVFYMVHLPERLEEILFVCEEYKIVVKKIQFIYSSYGKNASMVLIKCVKNANNGLLVNPPLFINEYTSYKNIFRR